MGSIAYFLENLLKPQRGVGANGRNPVRRGDPLDYIISMVSSEVDTLRAEISIPGRFLISGISVTPKNEDATKSLGLLKKHRHPMKINQAVAARIRKLNKDIATTPEFEVRLVLPEEGEYSSNSAAWPEYPNDLNDGNWEMPYEIDIEWQADDELPEEPLHSGRPLHQRNSKSLAILHIQDGGATHIVEVKKFPFTIGNVKATDPVDLKLAAVHVSRKHCTIDRNPGGEITIRDHSTNGTFLEDGTDLKDKPAVLKKGSRVTLDFALGRDKQMFTSNQKNGDRKNYPKIVVEYPTDVQGTPLCKPHGRTDEEDTPRPRAL